MWEGASGRVNRDWLLQCVPNISQQRIYLCGPEPMMELSRELLLSLGVPTTQILTEAFVSPGVARVGMPDHPLVPSVDPAQMPQQEFPDQAQITFVQSGQTTSVDAQTNILEAGEKLGLSLSYECRSGVCGQCKIKLNSGRVAMDVEDALSASEKKMGWILACQARPLADVVVEA
jgi:ferredoxin